MIFLYENKFVSDPSLARLVEDTPEDLSNLLDNPVEVGEDDDAPGGKSAAWVLCGARYFPGSTNREKENIEGVECLVLDVDCPDTPEGRVPPENVLRAALEGTRAIVYASPSHTPEEPRWRVLLPLLSPLPPKKHRSLVAWLSENLVPGYEGCINVESTGDPGRLGFVNVTKHPEHYTWWRQEGAKLDWTVLRLEDEVWHVGPLSGLERNPLWTDRETALKAALREFDTKGQGLRAGQGRSQLLWAVAQRLWWVYAAEDEDFVFTVLKHVNSNFREPESDDEILRQMGEAHKRTVGDTRKGQTAGQYGYARSPSNLISNASIIAHAQRLKRKHNPSDSVVGEALRRLAKGLTLDDDVALYETLLEKCMQALARLYPAESADRIADVFRGSLNAMRAKGKTTLPSDDAIRAILETKLNGARKFREENQARADFKEKSEIEFATNGVRNTKYTRQEIETWEAVGLTPRTWILVCKRAFYVFKNGTWVGPYTKEEFEAQGYLDLAASDIRTKVYNEERGTFTNVPLNKLVADYGSRCTTRFELNCEKTWFDLEEHELVLEGPPRSNLEPRFHDEVDQWLRIMTGRDFLVKGIVDEVPPGMLTSEAIALVNENGGWTTPGSPKIRQQEAAGNGKGHSSYDALCDWLACLTQLDHPCAALYLQGARSIGKGLFANGIAKLWKRGSALALDKAVGDRFNDSLLHVPFIWVDEHLPEKQSASALLRKVLAARDFVVESKFEKAINVTGCIRMLFTANNLDLFNRNKEFVKREDVDALALRFVHIHVRSEAALFLKSIGPRHEDFVKRNMLAEHALWLQEKRWAAVKARGHRFLVEGTNTNVSDVVATNSDSASECCNAICEVLVGNTGGFGGGGQRSSWCLVKDDKVLINAGLLKMHLVNTSNTAKNYTEREVVRAVSSISEGKSEVVYNTQTKKAMRMIPLRVAALRAWCENTGVYDWRDVEAAISRLNKETRAYEKSVEDKAEAEKAKIVN